MDWIVSVNNAVNAIAWGYILLACVLGGGLYLTVRTGFLQFRKFAYAMKNTIGKMFHRQKAGAGAITPFQAVSTALAATIGTGNIVGTSQAIALGGYGAVFWMWVAALFGMVIKYSEVVLAIRYRERNAAGDWVGGPMYYITNGLGKSWKWLAGLFAAFGALAAFGIGNMSQANSIAGAVNTAAAAFNPAAAGAAGTINLAVGIILAVFAGLVLLGGLKRIGAVAEKLVPFMSVVYGLCTLTVILMNIGRVGDALGKIFVGAFDPSAVLGGAFGITVSRTVTWGLKRSAFSNEAGLGSAPIAHAAAHTDSPVAQGLYGIFEVFMDTIIICTLTALTIVVSEVPVQFAVKPGAELIGSGRPGLATK
ncbi:MAG TPA: amino acid carrier protein, partial [Oscillospiraceae bacterium]|nr:amino acid carrier protein [Oscillospiraceae bacterium]